LQTACKNTNQVTLVIHCNIMHFICCFIDMSMALGGDDADYIEISRLDGLVG